MVRRIADEIEGYVVELGTDGRLLALQLDEMLAGVEEDRGLLVRDYLPGGGRRPRTIERGARRPRRAVRDRAARPRRRRPAARAADVAGRAGLPRSARAATGCWPGCRGCPAAIIDRLVDHFGGLQKLLAATVEDLQAVEGVGEARARGVREGLSRLAETSILDRYS